jgi:hypothetical protein
MNFAEFPIAALGKRRPGQKTLTFSDTVHGDNGKLFPRTLTITASDAWGLPTSADDEIILGLVQISAQTDFSSQTLHFTRYQLLKILGWIDTQTNYSRLEESLKRWTGITISYDRAWWDNNEKSWVSETFGVIDSVSIYDRERRERRLKMFKDDPKAGCSSIRWSDVVYTSFLSGNIKSLNFEFYKSLNTPISRRMFRFLDKRLYSKRSLNIDLSTFSYAHLGMSVRPDNYELRRKLLPAITELEVKGFLAPLPPSERFKQVSRGRWEVTFARATEKKDEPIVVSSCDDSPSPKKQAAATKRPRRQRRDDERQQPLFVAPYPVPPVVPPSVQVKRAYVRTKREEEAAAEAKRMMEELGLRKRVSPSA